VPADPADNRNGQNDFCYPPNKRPSRPHCGQLYDPACVRLCSWLVVSGPILHHESRGEMPMGWSIRYQVLVPLGLLLLGLVGICSWTGWDSARLARQRIANQVQGIVMTLGDSRIHLNQQILDHLRGLTGAEFLLFDSGGQRLATISGQAG